MEQHLSDYCDPVLPGQTLTCEIDTSEGSIKFRIDNKDWERTEILPWLKNGDFYPSVILQEEGDKVSFIQPFGLDGDKKKTVKK